MKNNHVKRAIDTNLSCLHVTKQDTLIIMNHVREGKKVKKKLSVAFVFVLAVLLLAVTAFAISTLSGLTFLDRQDHGSPITGQSLTKNQQNNGISTEKRVLQSNNR